MITWLPCALLRHPNGPRACYSNLFDDVEGIAQSVNAVNDLGRLGDVVALQHIDGVQPGSSVVLVVAICHNFPSSRIAFTKDGTSRHRNTWGVSQVCRFSLFALISHPG